MRLYIDAPVIFTTTMTIPEIKKEFFAYRNGIVADTLRKNGDPHQFIMGCQLVDIQGIAQRTVQSVQLAEELWSDRKHRECRIIATMLYPMGEMTPDTAIEWARDVECKEIADILCHRLLRKHPAATDVINILLNDCTTPLAHYTALRLLLNLILLNKISDRGYIQDIIDKEEAAQPQRDIVQLLDSIKEEL